MHGVYASIMLFCIKFEISRLFFNLRRGSHGYGEMTVNNWHGHAGMSRLKVLCVEGNAVSCFLPVVYPLDHSVKQTQCCGSWAKKVRARLGL